MMTFANGLESDFVLKLIILGETDAGKTCLVTRFLHHTFMEHPAHVRLYQYSINKILVIVLFCVDIYLFLQ